MKTSGRQARDVRLGETEPMKIAKMEATWLRAPIPPERQHVSDFGRMAFFDTTLVRVETDEGHVGYGEAKAAVGSQGNCAALVALIEQDLAPQLIGEDASQISRIWDICYNGSRAHFAIDRGHAFPIAGRRGLAIAALGGIDIALWDIAGKALGVPLHRLLGGKRKDRFPAYASGGWKPPADIGAELQGFIDRGDFKAVKMRVGSQDDVVQMSVARVRAAREALGPDIDIMVDAHGTWNVAEAKRFARAVADCRIAWFEEPVTGDDKRGMAEVRASTDIPIAAGESEFTRFDFRDIVELRAADILQPDLAIAGGVSEAMRIGALAAAWNLGFAPHLWTGALGFAAGLHVLSASTAGWIVEYSLGHNPLLHDLVEEDFPVVAGEVEVPDRPGLGVTIDGAFVKETAQPK